MHDYDVDDQSDRILYAAHIKLVFGNAGDRGHVVARSSSSVIHTAATVGLLPCWNILQRNYEKPNGMYMIGYNQRQCLAVPHHVMACSEARHLEHGRVAYPSQKGPATVTLSD